MVRPEPEPDPFLLPLLLALGGLPASCYAVCGLTAPVEWVWTPLWKCLAMVLLLDMLAWVVTGVLVLRTMVSQTDPLERCR